MVVNNVTAGFILERLELGQRVALLVENQQQGRVAQQTILGEMDEAMLEVASIKLGRVDVGDGQLTIHTWSRVRSGGLRGMALDALYYPEARRLDPEMEGLATALVARDGIYLAYAA